ncbi:hypothetical protein NECID01_1363 [Nematocida sp. AWRm77]|nr:hypothetical protein NECID01_1363 [Nematocida sp. AWRm77]
MEFELYAAYKLVEFEESILLLLEHLFREKETPEVFCMLVKSLLRSGSYEAIKWVVSRHKEYFEYDQVKKVYIEAMKRTGSLSGIDPNMCAGGKSLERAEETSPVPIASASINSYYQGLIQKGKDTQKKKYVENAIKEDERNLEAFIYMGMNYSLEELERCVKSVQNKELRLLFAKLLLQSPGSFSIFSRSFLSPFSCCRIAKHLFNEKRVGELFQLAQYMATLYPKHYFTYVVAGMYYLHVGKHSDAKRALFQAVQMNNSLGLSWLLLGFCQSVLCECNNAIACYEKAEALMEENGLASLGIALEYHRMRSYQKAEEKYLEIQKKHSLSMCFNSYVSLLVTLGRYDEAIEKIKHKTFTGEGALLQSFCYLFVSKQDMAEEALESVNMSFDSSTRSKYYLLKGYIHHIKRRYCEAIESYQKAILDAGKPGDSLVNDLLELAIKNSLDSSTAKLSICQYGEDVFEFLDLKSDLSIVL